MQRYRISGVPIVETLENRKLVVIITNRDMRFINIIMSQFRGTHDK